MLALLALLAPTLCVPGQTTNEIYKVRASVVDVSQLREFKGTAARTLTADPRFALTLRLESITPPLTNYTNGSLLSFAIHSPALIGLDEGSKGRRYDFVLSREVHGVTNGPWWFKMPAVPVGQPDGAANGAPISSH